jgi:transcriptional regulator with XRE-family HTH domain
MYNITIGNNIRSFRERLNLSQEVLAEYLGVSRPMISLLENGERTVTLVHLTKLADLFGVDEYDLMEEEAPQHLANVALAFRADQLSAPALESVASFKKIVKNYLKIHQALEPTTF